MSMQAVQEMQEKVEVSRQTHQKVRTKLVEVQGEIAGLPFGERTGEQLAELDRLTKLEARAYECYQDLLSAQSSLERQTLAHMNAFIEEIDRERTAKQ